MPRISEKGMQMPASPIRKLVPLAEQAAKAGKKVLHLNIGQPDIEAPRVAMEAVGNHPLRHLEYSHSAGRASYQEKLSAYYRSIGIHVDEAEIMVTTGGSEALLFAFLSCVDPGDEVIISEPFYANYNGFAQMAGVRIVPVTTSIEREFALPDTADFERLITEKTRGIVICNPHNPTGYVYTAAELDQLRSLVLKHDLYLFADEVYREFCYDGTSSLSAMQLSGAEDHVVLIDSISKRYSMCGARIGALISKNTSVMETALKFAQARLSPPTLAQIAGEAALRTPPTYFERIREVYAERRNLLVKGLNGIEGVHCPTPKGAFYCMAQFPVDSTEAFCEWLLREFDHRGTTVMMAPATGFYVTEGLGEREARIAYVLEKEALQAAVDCLSAALDAYPGRR